MTTTKPRPPKSPRVPKFPPSVVPLVDQLNALISAPETAQERRATAYGLLTRLCVLWSVQSPPGWPSVRVDYVPATGLLHFDNELVRDTVHLMNELFPAGEGLPVQEGCGAL